MSSSWLVWGLTSSVLYSAASTLLPQLAPLSAAFRTGSFSAHPAALRSLAAFAVAAWASSYRKSFPFAFHVRGILLFARRLIAALARGRGFKTPGETFTTSHVVLLGDYDFNLHQNNSMYNLEVDVQRFGLLTDLIAGQCPAAFPLLNWGWKIANGGVSVFFLVELKLHTQYEIRSRVVSIDSKWLYFRSDFVSRGARGETLHAVALSRFVFKQSRKTIPPAEAFERLGYKADDIAALLAGGTPESTAGATWSAIAATLVGLPASPPANK
jgi:hypothetical protein